MAARQRKRATHGRGPALKQAAATAGGDGSTMSTLRES